MSGGLLTFDQVLTQVSTPHLLLGNGFSMAYDSQRFSFTTLLESAVKENIIDEKSCVYKVFQKIETADFESVMKSLEESEKIIAVYNGDSSLRENILQDAKSLKGYLVKIITNNHPETSVEIPEQKKSSCINFLAKFKNIYTLNYDLFYIGQR